MPACPSCLQLLGCHLHYLISILKRHQVQLLWASNAKTMTYVWFKHLQSLLCLFQRLSIEATWKLDSNFLPLAPDHPEVCPINQDGQHFVNVLQEWDTLLLAQWRPRNRLHAAAAFYDAATVPSSHFVQTPTTPRIPRNSTPAGATGVTPPLSGNRRPAPAPDFKAIKPLFLALVNPPLKAKGILDQFQGASPSGSRKTIFQHPNGSSSLICFMSCAAAPFNVCNTTNCLNAQRSRARPRTATSRYPQDSSFKCAP
jgi:hypothetical protein